VTLPLTPSQTVGPYLAIGLVWPDGPDVVPAGTPGAIEIVGCLYDGAGAPVPDGLIETWQADPLGAFAHPDDPRNRPGPGLGASGGRDPVGASGRPDPPDGLGGERQAGGFRGFGRCPTAAGGRYRIRTLKPAPLPAPGGGTEAPHLDVSVFARGLLDRVVTRIYFPDETAANDADPVLSAIGDPARRATLIAIADGDMLRFDIHLQGEHETVFFLL